jgi:hypothetical protein
LKGAAHWTTGKKWRGERLGGRSGIQPVHSSWTWKSLKL